MVISVCMQCVCVCMCVYLCDCMCMHAVCVHACVHIGLGPEDVSLLTRCPIRIKFQVVLVTFSHAAADTVVCSVC